MKLLRFVRSRNASGRSSAPDLEDGATRFGETVVVLANDRRADSLARSSPEVEEVASSVDLEDLYVVVQKGRLFQQEQPSARVLLDKGRYLLVELSKREAKRIASPGEPCYSIRPFQPGETVFSDRAAASRAAPLPWVQHLVDELSPSNFEAALNHLTSFPTRHSTSAHYATAATWARDQLQALGYASRLENVSVGGATSSNVIADRPGSGAGNRELVIVCAHLDSVNTAGGPTAPAPGADDNGSGSAGLLEMARVLGGRETVHDLRLILFGGEEQGLHGSTQYVAGLSPAERSRIRAVVNMDMIATLNTAQPTVLIEGAAVSQNLIDGLAEAAAIYSTLDVQTSLNPFASDHVPFIQAGLPAVLTIEGADGANSNIHTANDTLAHINPNLALQILRMNVAHAALELGHSTGDTMPTSNTLQRSGRYVHNGGATLREGTDPRLNNPILARDSPIVAPPDPPPVDPEIRFSLHVDIDGTDPLDVVSGTVARGQSGQAAHFIGRVTTNDSACNGRSLVVEDFSFDWPGSSDTIDRLEIEMTGDPFGLRAEVVFIDTAHGRRHGAFSVPRQSMYFRDVEIEVDRETGFVEVEPYDTHTHPDRPADLPQEHLTLESTFAKSGIRITRPAPGPEIDTSEAGANDRWNNQELHDSMETHWQAFDNSPQWKMWVFMANLADSDTLGGIMFDGNINEPGGVDRQGTALFTKCPFFHTEGGGYIQANPPTAEAVERELFFNLIHETGHAFNLAHSFQKTLGDPWDAPPWMPVTSDSQALSWMNYPDAASPGLNATWFYDRFRFRFDDNENLFLRHAPESFVQMGNEDWFENHGRAPRGSLDRRLSLAVRSRKDEVEMGETVMLELRLRNESDEVVPVHEALDPGEGLTQLAITDPDGVRRPFIPVAHARHRVAQRMLAPGEAMYAAVNATIGKFGIPFKKPGPYRIEASYRNSDDSTAAAIMQLYVRPASDFDHQRAVNELFNARTGRVLAVGGTRALEDECEKLDWVLGRLEKKHPVRHYLSMARWQPFARPHKLAPASGPFRLLEPDPDRVERELRPVVEDPAGAADSIGHIRYRSIVDTYTDCALECRKSSAARDAQDTLLRLYQERNVVERVVNEVEARVKKLRPARRTKSKSRRAKAATA